MTLSVRVVVEGDDGEVARSIEATECWSSVLGVVREKLDEAGVDADVTALLCPVGPREWPKEDKLGP